MMNHTILRQKIADVQAQVVSEREWWDKRRASIQSDFMKELDVNSAATSSSKPTTPGERIGSDEEAVFVEGGGPAAAGKGSTRRKKGKK